MNRIDFVNKNYNDIVNAVIERVKTKYPDKWNDFYEDSSAVMMIELFGYVIDVLLYYLDHNANEAFLPTATERQSVINLCKLIGYRVSPARPATADIVFTLKSPHATDVTIPSGTALSTRNGIIFETVSEIVIPAGELAVIGGALHGESFNEIVGISSGTASQRFSISRSSIIDVRRVIIGGRNWKMVESLLEFDGTEEVYVVDIDAWGRARISFGDGINGRIPISDSRVEVFYRTGGGRKGNVMPNTIISMRDIATDANGNTVTVSVSNPVQASGGADPESLERAKLWGPRFYTTLGRCVTGEDCKTTAMTFESPTSGVIAKANAVVMHREGEGNIIRYFVLTYSSEEGHVAQASEELKKELLAYLDEHKMFHVFNVIEDGHEKRVDVDCKVGLIAGWSLESVIADIKKSLQILFSVDTREMGQSLKISDIFATIDNTNGVDFVEIATPKESFEASANELLTLGNLTIAEI